MADEKKIVPEPEKPNMTAASERPIMDKGDPPVHEKVTPTKAEVYTQKPLSEQQSLQKEQQQAVQALDDLLRF